MKNKGIKAIIAALALTGFSACNDFEDVNVSPSSFDKENVLIQALFNSSVYDAQLSDWSRDIIFMRTWAWGARTIYSPSGGPQVFADNNNYMSNYWQELAQWIFDATQAIEIGNERLGQPNIDEATNNYIQMSRIWRAHLFAEAADMFGPYPALNGFKGEVAEYNSVEEVYDYVDKELADAVSKLQPDVAIDASYDAFYSGDINKWKKFGNSLRLRYAMRFSNVGDTGKQRVQQVWADADRNIDNFISDNADIASVAQATITTTKPAGSVYDLDYIDMPMTATASNMAFGLGHISLDEIAQVNGTSAYNLPADKLQAARDPMEYLGQYRGATSYEPQYRLPVNTNVETAGYLFDCLPKYIDPRMMAMFHIPGHPEQNFCYDLLASIGYEYPNHDLNMAYTYSTFSVGRVPTGYTMIGNAFRYENGYMPGIAAKWRRGGRRVFFGDWETQFLLAEASLYGWINAGQDQTYYENGVRASFTYFGLSQFADAYLADQHPNRVGVTADYGFENKAASVTMKRDVFNGKGNVSKNQDITYHFPKNAKEVDSRYISHDSKLAKIMTQKFLAQMLWLPLEITNDYRRTGLPFNENPYFDEGSLTYMQDFYNAGNFTESTVDFTYCRVRYPVELQSKNAPGYAHALELLGGPDKPETPLVWQLKYQKNK